MKLHSSVKMKTTLFENESSSIISSPKIKSTMSKSINSSSTTVTTTTTIEINRLNEMKLKLDKLEKQSLLDTQRIKLMESELQVEAAKYMNIVTSLREIGIDSTEILSHHGQKPKKRGSFLSTLQSGTLVVTNGGIEKFTSANDVSTKDVMEIDSTQKDIETLVVENTLLKQQNQTYLVENTELKLKNSQLSMRLVELQDKTTSSTYAAQNEVEMDRYCIYVHVLYVYVCAI
jgi:regulator of replication initiation timing